MPQDLDLSDGWTFQIAGLDSNGNAVAGVNIGLVAITAENISGGSLDFGTFLLVPGPGA